MAVWGLAEVKPRYFLQLFRLCSALRHPPQPAPCQHREKKSAAPLSQEVLREPVPVPAEGCPPMEAAYMAAYACACGSPPAMPAMPAMTPGTSSW
eukprot:CAMPEP_0172621178 /NCGR_PEP_ID=MMETSP1068-20121228/109961_1 /TAXON_ID=35684 /ORGANISM="Pseudopedinella elastica, Strain CCMP716" /LENGTH=94 /DNA_ID=CAMNT_0013428807 /DNA_START=22 /DNA_END=306 /DNA_ORIENTATION=+